MLLFPNAKINIGLRIVEKRPDGFHNIETFFYPLDLCDILEFVPIGHDVPDLRITGIPTGGNAMDNLVIKAWQLMKDKYGIPAVNIHLHKVIPVGAGLGGGSSDAAFMLKGLNKWFGCGCDIGELKEMALKLGSDCPFFIDNVPAMGTGRGEVLKPMSVSLKGYIILLKKPGIQINTGWAYGGIKPAVPVSPLEKLIRKPVNMWKHSVINDFEKVVFPVFPEIEAIKNRFIEMGGDYSAMSGSGSAVFGLFRKEILDKTDPGVYEDCFVIRNDQQTTDTH